MSFTSDVAHHIARKEHQCSWCNEAIAIGENYSTYVSTFDGFGVVKLHSECLDAMHRSDLYDDEGFILGANTRGEIAA